MRISGAAGSAVSAAPKGKISSLKPIFNYLRPYRTQSLLASFALCFTSAAVLGMGKGLSYLVDEGIGKGDVHLLNKAFMLLAGIVLLLAFATYARYYLVSWIGEKVVADIRGDVYKHLLRQDMGFFETTRTGELLSLLTTDTTLLQTVVGSSVSIAMRNSLLLIGGCTMLMVTSMRLSGYVFLVVPLVVVPIIFLGRKVRVLSRESQSKIADISSHAEETLSGMRTIQSLVLEEYEFKRFSGYVDEALQVAIRRIRLRALLTAIAITMVLGAVVAVLWLGGHDVINGVISAGDLSAFVFYAMLVAGATGAISEVVGDLQRAAGAMERLMEMKEIVPLISTPLEPLNLPEKFAGNLSFDKVSFYYPSRPLYAALDEVSFNIKTGERIALVGPSGAGKSTIMQLLLRFYDAKSGSILIDGLDLTKLDPRGFRAHIGLVPQDPVMFSTTARENIALGKISASEAEIITAAQQSECWEFIQKLPDGLDSQLGEKGVRLSGGQRQRMAIARVMLRNPDILLLDEATSALDSENEQKVQQALEKLMHGRTSLVIAHRLATVQNADRILVLDEGRVQASGTHEELLVSSPLYARLAKMQFGE